MFFDEDIDPCKSLSPTYLNGDKEICGKLLNNLDTAAMLRLSAYFYKSNPDQQHNGDKCNLGTLRIDEGHFVNAINTIFGCLKYNLDALKLFKILDFEECGSISWNQLLEHLIDFTEKKTGRYLKSCPTIKKSDILIKDLDHCKKEPISVIIRIETKVYFCYAIISKHGKVGIYDGKLNLLLEYDIFFNRSGVLKRVRDVWITAAVFLKDMKNLTITLSDKSLMIYDVSTLCHNLIFIITGITNIPTCMSYISSNNQCVKSHLIIGDDLGGLTTISFKQPKIGPFFRKNSDKLTSYFWIELQSTSNEPFCRIKFKRRIHSRPVKKIVYIPKNNYIVSCSSDCDASVVIQHSKGLINSYVFKVPRGVTCFHYSENLNLMVTGGADKRLRLWEPVVTEKPSAIFPAQSAKIIDVVILAHLHTIINLNKYGVLKVWNIFDQVCVQSVNINFPSFGVLGRPIQFGFESIYCGSARVDPYEMMRREITEYFDKDLIVNSDVTNDSDIDTDMYKTIEYLEWSRAEILIICYNHVATIPMSNKSILNSDININNDENNIDIYALLPPPEKNHRPRKPSVWDDDDEKLTVKNSQTETKFDVDSENFEQLHNFDYLQTKYDCVYNCTSLEDLLEKTDLKEILEKDFIGDSRYKHNVNTKYIVQLPKQEKMRQSVSQSAPFTALDLHQHEDIKFSTCLPLSTRMQKKFGVEYFKEPQQILRYDSRFSMGSPKSNYTVTTDNEHAV